MKCLLSFVCVLSVLVLFSEAAPAPQADTNQERPSGGLPFLDQSTIQRILESKRQAITVLRKLFPDLAKVVDNVIQNVTSQVFRIVGRALLQGGGLGGGGGGDGGNSTRRVSVTLPTFPPDLDDDEDEDEESESVSNELSSSSSTTTTENIVDTRMEEVSSSTEASPASEAENNLRKRHIRIARASEGAKSDQDTAASNAVPEPEEDLANFDDDDADRNKRAFLPFGGGGDGHSSGGGSGNFLFDIIRQTADRTARTIGTVYRMVAGTESLNWGTTATKTLAPAAIPQLVAGSGATEESDEKENSPGGVAEVDVAKGDGYTEGIPGPITRLLVIANRGLANLVQDLILRLAQTSERIVNFKARLVTSLI